MKPPNRGNLIDAIAANIQTEKKGPGRPPKKVEKEKLLLKGIYVRAEDDIKLSKIKIKYQEEYKIKLNDSQIMRILIDDLDYNKFVELKEKSDI